MDEIMDRQRQQASAAPIILGIGAAAGVGLFFAYKQGYLDQFMPKNGNGPGIDCGEGYIWNPETLVCDPVNGSGVPVFSWPLRVIGAEALPVSGAIVEIECRGNIAGECTDCPCVAGDIYQAVTDSDGIATFVSIPTGFYNLRISASGYEDYVEFALNRSQEREYYTSTYALEIDIGGATQYTWDEAIDPGVKGDSQGRIMLIGFPEPMTLQAFSGQFEIVNVCPGCWTKVGGAWEVYAVLADGSTVTIVTAPDYTDPINYGFGGLNPGWYSLAATPNLQNVVAIVLNCTGQVGLGDFVYRLSRWVGTAQGVI